MPAPSSSHEWPISDAGRKLLAKRIENFADPRTGKSIKFESLARMVAEEAKTPVSGRAIIDIVEGKRHGSGLLEALCEVLNVPLHRVLPLAEDKIKLLDAWETLAEHNPRRAAAKLAALEEDAATELKAAGASLHRHGNGDDAEPPSRQKRRLTDA